MKIQHIIILSLLLIACASKESRINKLVNLYNSVSLDANDSYMKSIKAQKTSEDEITITIFVDVPSEGTTSQMYTSIFPDLMEQMVFSIGLSKQLVREGVKLKCSLLADDNNIIVEKTFDQISLQENGNKKNELFDDGSDIDLYKMAELINKGLPVTDSINDMTILKLDMLNKTEAQFIYLVTDEMLDLIMIDESIAEFMKTEYLSNPKQKKALLEFFNLGLEKFYLTYMNKEQTRNKKIEFTKSDVLK